MQTYTLKLTEEQAREFMNNYLTPESKNTDCEIARQLHEQLPLIAKYKAEQGKPTGTDLLQYKDGHYEGTLSEEQYQWIKDNSVQPARATEGLRELFKKRPYMWDEEKWEAILDMFDKEFATLASRITALEQKGTPQ